MITLYSIEDLIENLEETRILREYERVRKFLKIFLIGFFIRRDDKKRIEDLSSKAHDILSHLFESHFLGKKLITLGKSNICASLTQIEQMIKSHKDVFSESDYHSNLSKINDFRNRLVDQTLGILQQNIGTLEKQVKEILGSGTYLLSSENKECLALIETLENELGQCTKSAILTVDYIDKIKKRLETARQSILSYNPAFVRQRKKDYRYLWSNGHFTLDNEQQTAVVTDDKHNLVVAATGSGKTEVLITRIAYIIKRQPDSSPPEKILAIAFQRKVRDEIEQRLLDHYDIKNTNVSTFHKLGKNILEEAGSKYRHADIINDNKKHELVEKIFKQKIYSDPNFYQLFLNFVKTLHDKENEAIEVTKDEALEYAQEQTYCSIDRTEVKSRAEKEIIDFFLMHKLNGKRIRVNYEPDVAGFRPDFYLPEYDLYLEHWAITKNGDVPEWFNQSTKEYTKSMEIKKKWFFEHNKLFVETFAHEYNVDQPHTFIDLLKKRVITTIQTRSNADIKFTLKSYDELVEIAWNSYRTPVDDLINFITTAKTYGLSTEKIEKRLEEKKWSPKQIAFGTLVLPIYAEYEKFLDSNDKIDFEDMINKAISELENNPELRSGVYDHILIDEYQDISAQRYYLLKQLMDRNPNCRLFCVGDDWQSIMGFSGSNINFFVNFAKYFEEPTITIISTNYRSTGTIVDAGADLIKKK